MIKRSASWLNLLSSTIRIGHYLQEQFFFFEITQLPNILLIECLLSSLSTFPSLSKEVFRILIPEKALCKSGLIGCLPGDCQSSSFSSSIFSRLGSKLIEFNLLWDTDRCLEFSFASS